MKKMLFVLFMVALAPILFATEFISIGTGAITGTYYPTGNTICRLVNQYKKESSIRCLVKSTAGSVYNIQALKKNDISLAMVQSDIAYQAYHGMGQFQENKASNIRLVMAIYPELFTFVTRKDANINSIMDIKGKRINLGNTGSGNETTALALLEALEIKKSDLALATEFKAAEMPNALRNNQIDGYFYMVGHPTSNIKEIAHSMDIKIVPIVGEKVNTFVKDHPYFIQTSVPANLYKNNENSIPTFGVKAALVANANVSDETVYLVVKAILENFEEFKTLHPAYSYMTKKSLLEGVHIPLHIGAKRYYQEKGLLP